MKEININKEKHMLRYYVEVFDLKRRELGISERALSTSIHRDPSYFSSLKNNKVQLSFSVFIDLCYALDLQIVPLFSSYFQSEQDLSSSLNSEAAKIRKKYLDEIDEVLILI